MVNQITKPSKKNKHERITKRKFEKKVPDMILGISVTTPLKGMEGTLEWLKDIRIHKYWAFFSHLTYAEMVSIDEDSLELFLHKYGATGKIPEGAKNKIIKSITELRERSDKLKKINPAEVEESCTIISSILKTPLSEIHLEKDGTDLTGLLEHKIRIVVETSMKLKEGDKFIKPLLEEYAKHPSITIDEKKSAEAWLDSIYTNTFYRRKYSYALTGIQPEDAIIKKPEVELKKKIFSPIEDQKKIPSKPDVEIKKAILSPIKAPVKIDWKNKEVELQNEIIKNEYSLVIERILNQPKSINETIPHPEFTKSYEMILNPMYALKNEMIPHPEFTKSYEMVINSKCPMNNETTVKRNNELRKMCDKLDKLELELEQTSYMAFSFFKTSDSNIVKNKLMQVNNKFRKFMEDITSDKPEPTNLFSTYMEKHILSPYPSPQLYFYPEFKRF